MKDFLVYVLSQFLDHKEKIKVDEQIIDNNYYQYIISSDKEDMGKIIGKQGKIIQALRNVIKILAIKKGIRVRIEVV
ncbi:hypothetical protein COV53_03405 [Candidatus Gottesmanbacteria bacterium CG11_big_fil_rev_8_21_14_0_20_37_11]|uniref:Uncharacterized protein n=3 Tax=Candidatus Gottesmaniibacteriota TaxID=1752720 RepID=A0A2M7RQJ7_9BACT|nr:MAG: hypothetical protein AUJ73_05280 [Candidatus Gottesmanbacteria bacterium CG1_02_37_22]PIP32253.1 MAG: hypothetical protein COX23_05625 [Candidatus Gottesmanbacteria bacterium CG23_combo_of_CG06-09_8_20_14_all_37_19]PIR08367.1 MAG: hypothetical protein COV53_03405 [Candidatus Gottesmanbacteria bacterium CG11_big_fil_rev_8_21_14_0_20_37_11]PIZ02319.1 MAG: hypothetical protein COY59_05320 [Candidatus Gottesmanbacteria bacterium CG_4_10_14_0_8_um_filter_37_24]